MVRTEKEPGKAPIPDKFIYDMDEMPKLYTQDFDFQNPDVLDNLYVYE